MRQRKEKESKRKTVDYYKLEKKIKGRWETILDTDNYEEYKTMHEKTIARQYPYGRDYRGKKYRRIKEAQ